MPNPLTVGRRATARLEEAILLALEEHRDQGYLNTLRLAERIGWDNDGMPSPNGQGYGRIAVIGLLYKLYLAGKVEPAHQPNRRGHWGGWRISDEEYARRSGQDVESVPVPAPLHIAGALLSGEVPLAEYPLPPAEGLMPPLPEAIRFPDGTEYELRRWEEILTRTVEWLNETRILTLANVPVKHGPRARLPGERRTSPLGWAAHGEKGAGKWAGSVMGVHENTGNARLPRGLPLQAAAGTVPPGPRRDVPGASRR